ncbi:hypothetical protein [Kribbella sp.]|uniref:hypothetical protein n=1 Tax=Kribbella sp. TaxID=1871183 RepID=UPI002D53B4EF|nr:hypothetical protein [Kribbella sp.]HZX04418.1 hypothetical protein [Kribbella sp.]
MTPGELKAALSTSVDNQLAEQLVDEFVSVEEAFLLKKWKYSELDGGRFAEVAARIIYSVDSSNLSRTKSVDDCLKYIDNDQVPHKFPERQGAIHLAKVLRAIYKLRSQRGAVHVSPTYTANEIDSRLIIECVRWVLADILRVFVTTDREKVAETVRSLARFPQPLIRNIEGQPLLQSVSFTTEEEVLAHLLNADDGLATAELVKVVPKAASGVRAAISNMSKAKTRQIANRNGKWFITDLGVTRIEERLVEESGK